MALPYESSRFWLRPTSTPPESWHEVSRAEYVHAERVAGFTSRYGQDVPATYAFSAEFIEGCSRAPGQPAPSQTADAAD